MKYDELKKENVIIEMNNLVQKAEEFQKEVDAYCEFMKGVILNTSGLN